MVYSCEKYDTAADYWISAISPPITECDSNGIKVEALTCEDDDLWGTYLDTSTNCGGSGCNCEWYLANPGDCGSYDGGTGAGGNAFDAATMCCACDDGGSPPV